MPNDERLPFEAPATEVGPVGDEFVFRFHLDPDLQDPDAHPDPLVELVRGQLADLLRCAVLTCGGRRVRADGFRLLRDPDTQYVIFPSGGTGS
jgi:hypothetical protein